LEGGAEIDHDAANLAAFEREELRVAKAPAICRQTAIGHEGFVAPNEDALDVVAGDPAGVAPAALEIGRLVEAVIERAGEAKIISERVADLLPVIGEIGGEEVSHQAFEVIGHRSISREPALKDDARVAMPTTCRSRIVRRMRNISKSRP
jgi:hypothetical protein